MRCRNCSVYNEGKLPAIIWIKDLEIIDKPPLIVEPAYEMKKQFILNPG
jgi:hypothetical protein